MDEQTHSWVGLPVFDATGQEFGAVAGLFLRPGDGSPAWVYVDRTDTGRPALVPGDGLRADDEGLDVPWPAETVLAAPLVDTAAGLTVEHERVLTAHYDQAAGRPGPNAGTESQPLTDEQGPYMLRSEEELRVGKERRQAGTVRMRKWVETEQVSEEVLLHSEHLQLERLPIDPASLPLAPAGVELGSTEIELVLHDEELIASKVAVPREVVRLSKQVVTEPYLVEADLRREQVVVEQDGVPVEQSQGGRR